MENRGHGENKWRHRRAQAEYQSRIQAHPTAGSSVLWGEGGRNSRRGRQASSRTGIIEEVRYLTWIANVVMVLKASKKWRMFVDYVDLNKACPKYWYPWPRIDKLVDSIFGHKILSFVDAYSGYQQIKMSREDQIHTIFRAAGGIYCYKMMPFGLKNAGAKYQRVVNKVFRSQIGRNLEAYINDMVIKTRESKHAQDLRKTFENLRRNHMKLNTSKCAFGVVSGKLLGLVVHEKGIEANPEKI